MTAGEAGRAEASLGDHADSEVTVIARWTNSESYEQLRDSSEFQQTMGRFAEKFVSPPSTSINEVLVEM